MAVFCRPSRVLAAAVLSAVLTLACNNGELGLNSAPVASIALHPNVISLEPGHSTRLTPILQDSRGATLTDRPVIWASNNPAVATVDTGLVVGVRQGVAEITATADGRSATASVLVRTSVSQVEIEPESPTVRVGASVQLMATPRGSDGKVLPDRVISWSTSDARVARVSVGKVRGIGVGSAVITATADQRRGTTTVTVLPNISGSWLVATTLTDPELGISCAGAGRLTIEQTSGIPEGTLEHDTTCEPVGATGELSGSSDLQDVSLSGTRLEFIHAGALRCGYVGELSGTPTTAAAGTVSCTTEANGATARLQGQWQMRR